MQGFSKEHESSFGDKNIMTKKKQDDLLLAIWREVGEISTKVDDLMSLKGDVEVLKADRNKTYGFLAAVSAIFGGIGAFLVKILS